MGLFNNPMEAPWSFKKKSSLLFWLIFTSGSVYCAEESLYTTTNLPKFVCYIMGLAIISTATFCLYLIRNATSDGFVQGRKVKLVLGIIFFPIFWFFIVAANTHYIFFQMSVEKMRLKELTVVNNNFDLAKNKFFSEIDSLNRNYDLQVENEISNLISEITNPGNPGHDKETDKILIRIGELTGGNVVLESRPPSPNNRDALREYANRNADKIRKIKEKNLQICITSKDKVSQILDENKNVRNELNETISNFEKTSEGEKKNALRRSYDLYDKVYKLISDILIPVHSETLKVDIASYKLPSIAPSIDIEDISSAWKFFFKGLYSAKFFWSIVLAMIIDIASFMFWYFGVLSKEEN
jgi:hypothetical protein